MASKTLIGGTAYNIVGGKTLVDGTAYNIYSGKTLIGGTAYTINLRPQTLKGLLSNAQLYAINGNNGSSNAAVSVTIGAAGTYYAFSSENGYLGIIKLVRSGSTVTKTVLKQANTSYGNVYINGTTCSYSRNGTSAYNTRPTLAVFTFPGYTEAQADAILTATTPTRRSGRNSSSSATAQVVSTNINGRMVAAHLGKYFSFVSVVDYSDKTVLYGNHTTNPSLIYMSSGGVTGISSNGTELTAYYGGGIATLT